MATTECTRYNRPVLTAYAPDNDLLYFYQPPCKCWDCASCARQNMFRWAARIGEGYKYYRESGIDGWAFVTLTSNPKLKNLRQTLWVWPKAWAKFSTRMRRKYPGVRYVLLPEMHKNGRLHIHMIASHGITATWVHKNAYACGLGYQDDAAPVEESNRAVWYTVKYLSKALGAEEWPKHIRRVRTSQKWPELENDPEIVDDTLVWEYLTTYPSDGLTYLAEGVGKIRGVATKII